MGLYDQDGTLQETFKANGGIFEVHFNKNGDKLAACTSNKQVKSDGDVEWRRKELMYMYRLLFWI